MDSAAHAAARSPYRRTHTVAKVLRIQYILRGTVIEDEVYAARGVVGRSAREREPVSGISRIVLPAATATSAHALAAT